MTKWLTILCVMALALTTLSVASLSADTIILRNGDRLSGTILRVQDNRLPVATRYADQDLVIRWQDIATLNSDDVITVRLRTGETFKDRRVLISGPTIKTAEFALDEVTAINPPADGQRAAGF